MKQENPLSALSIEELEVKKKKLKGVVYGLGIVVLATWCILIYLALARGKGSVLIAVACCSITSLVPTLISLTQLNTEIKNRTSK